MQIKEYEEIKLTRNVYKNCISIVRDKDILEGTLKNWDAGYDNGLTEAYEQLDSIHRALLEIPMEYRALVMDSIMQDKGLFDDIIHDNTLKKYRQKFIYSLAKILCFTET